MSCCGASHEPCNSHYLFHGTAVPAEQQKEVQRVHGVLQDLLEARANEKGEEVAKEKVLALQIPIAYAFPSPSATTSKANVLLLSITHLYWLSTISSLNTPAKMDLRSRLESIPSFEGTKLYSGNEVEESEAREELASEKKVEGLMRAGGLLLPGIVQDSVLSMWKELADVAAALWEY